MTLLTSLIKDISSDFLQKEIFSGKNVFLIIYVKQ